MHVDECLIFFDLETAGLEPKQHPIIQIAAIVVDSTLRELESFEAKIRFDESEADPKSLSKNRYDKKQWKREALDPAIAASKFSKFLRRHVTHDMISKDGKPYQVVAGRASFVDLSSRWSGR